MIVNEAKGLYSSSSLGIEEQFWGSSIFGVPHGYRFIRFGAEQYDMRPPSLAVRVVRGFTELVGESSVDCSASKLQAVINFEAKPLLRGTAHNVKGKILDTATGMQVRLCNIIA